ncbi:MAG: RNA methyltransferase [Candidatus Taylorbacteria bacterium CG11_big_fil_rev_8_21_14_0_20_46_11]|uniref:RNA methyltransferase n=1 Tax=Candidatus Taylorbacteria bacterium CG11_big_fil_rev_8_21_14_0_20_46_11 TaxID=1975025 RepID=A0A2H0KA42_9BACT|nr:MAG: RNA methyltransferase [Candidatus Taylorbacteria bacterium CG11_big_fil_rev_8_21_14_0_20_46_11]
MKKASRTAYIILHNIRSTHNVGAIFRTADAVGITKIYLTGYTPTPIDRFGRPRKDIAKAALGAEDTVAWEQVLRIGTLLIKLKKEGFYIVAVEQHAKSATYTDVVPQGKTVFIFGNEIAGLPASVLKDADVIAEIPMRGEKESLNVSVSAGIALFRILENEV